MHIPDGILPTAVCIGGYATTGATTWYALRKINQKENPREGVPKASLLTAAFFVASWIHIPIPPTSVHLVLNGLLGAVLGYYAFPAILIGLFFQAVMFQHGGLTTLGVNATMMGLPAFLAYYLFRLRHVLGRKADREGRPYQALTGVFGFLAGAGGLGIAALIATTLLITTIPAHLDSEAERASIYALTLAHVPLMIIEGVFTALVVLFLQRVRPELLGD
ncbi:MAG: cobalt transporter CbiM [Chloroflexi bacterium]|nr:cobalt transporter CbiM [Chloroflexota bacterium]